MRFAHAIVGVLGRHNLAAMSGDSCSLGGRKTQFALPVSMDISLHDLVGALIADLSYLCPLARCCALAGR